MGVLGRLGSILGCLGEFRAVLEASWEYLGPSGRGLGIVLEASWSRLGGVLGRLGPSWGLMRKSWGRLEGILCPIFSPQGAKFRHAILDAIFQLIFGGFCFRKSIPES